jgi:hypothetical protein
VGGGATATGVTLEACGTSNVDYAAGSPDKCTRSGASTNMGCRSVDYLPDNGKRGYGTRDAWIEGIVSKGVAGFSRFSRCGSKSTHGGQ